MLLTHWPYSTEGTEFSRRTLVSEKAFYSANFSDDTKSVCHPAVGTLTVDLLCKETFSVLT